MVRQLSPTKRTMRSTEWCAIQMANSKVRNTPRNSSWTSVVSHFHKRPTSVHSQPVFHLCRWHKFTYCWQIDCVKLCHSRRWPWCSNNLGRQMGNAIQHPKEQTSFDRKEPRQSPPVSMRGVLIPQVRTHKHLGRVLNESLTWSDHIPSVYTACARMIGILRRLDGTIRSPAMKKIYTAVIRSRMEYACAVLSGGPTGCLQRLQDSFAKRLSLSLPPLGKRFEYHTLVLFYRVRANLAPTYLSLLVPPLTSTKSGYSFRKESYPVPLTKKSAT